MSISVTVTIGEAVEVDASTDAAYSPDIASDLLARARETALAAYLAMDSES